VKLTGVVHTAVPAAVPAIKVHVRVSGVTGPVAVNVTVPDGVVRVVGATDVSVTRALHKDAWLITITLVAHVTAVVVA
jgi:hypothetical protein